MNKVFWPVAITLIVGFRVLVLAQAQLPQPQAAIQPRCEDILSKAVVRITGQAEGIDGTLNGDNRRTDHKFTNPKT
jgi:hypothetical protein